MCLNHLDQPTIQDFVNQIYLTKIHVHNIYHHAFIDLSSHLFKKFHQISESRFLLPKALLTIPKRYLPFQINPVP